MKLKQIVAAAMCGALALSLAACGKAASGSVASSAPAVSASAAASEAAPVQSTDGANAMQAITPPYEDKFHMGEIPGGDVLSADLQALYNAAGFLMSHFKLVTGFAIDYSGTPLTMDNGLQYYPDKGFASYSKFRAALDAVFTEELSNALFNESMAYVDDGNDALFSLDAGRGGNIFYKGCDFSLASESDTELVIAMTAHYAVEMTDAGEFGEEEQTEQYTHRLVKTDAGWRFAQFDFQY